jgi:hypothetical protein
MDGAHTEWMCQFVCYLFLLATWLPNVLVCVPFASPCSTAGYLNKGCDLLLISTPSSPNVFVMHVQPTAGKHVCSPSLEWLGDLEEQLKWGGGDVLKLASMHTGIYIYMCVCVYTYRYTHVHVHPHIHVCNAVQN